MLRPLLIATFFWAAALLVSCSPSVRTAKTPGADLSQYKTFAYLPNTAIDVAGVDDRERVNQMIVDEVKNDMDAKGYTVDPDNPDLLVLISVRKNEEVETTTEPVYAGYPYNPTYSTISPYYGNSYYRGYAGFGGYAGYDTDTEVYTEGTVVIDLIDRETKETVWKGVSSESIYEVGYTADEMTALVDAIFREFPKQKNRGKA